MASGNSQLFTTGLKNRQEVVGKVYVGKALENGSSEFAFPGQQLVTELVHLSTRVCCAILGLTF